MISVEAARARLLALAPAGPGTERVALRHAAGRVLAEDAVARLTQPPFPASAMDGYAIAAEDHRPGAWLAVIGTAAAGHAFGGRVVAGQAVRIFTGAPVPEGAGRVVIQEDVAAGEGFVTLGEKLDAAIHIRPAGQDFRAGDRLAAPRRLAPRDLALIAAMNLPEVTVARRPVVAILPTGDELVMPGEAPRPDQIVASNLFALAAMAEAAGAEARMLPVAGDSEAALRFAFGLAEDADVILTVGGASVGDHDLVGPVSRALGFDHAFWKIAMRPGKPLMAGLRGRTILLGLPGNPVSSVVCARLFLVPLIGALQGLPQVPEPLLPARLAEAVEQNGPRAHYMRARIEPAGDGGDGAAALPRVRPFARQDSALLTILSQADALILRAAGAPAATEGDQVGYLPL
ncbi:MAG: molybdopterin molybdotransferase MoeA [Paracoccaceae bacterium]